MLLLLASGCSGTSPDAGPAAATPSSSANGSSSSTACVRARATFTEVRNTLSRSGGSGPDARDAVRTLRDTVEQHVDCFDADTVQSTTHMAETFLPPTAAAEQALAEAEDSCGPDRSEFGGAPPPEGAPLAETPQQAMTDARDQGDALPNGEPARSFEGDGMVGFSFRDGDGFQGWVLTVRTDRGWYARHVVTCGGSPATKGGGSPATTG